MSRSPGAGACPCQSLNSGLWPTFPAAAAVFVTRFPFRRWELSFQFENVDWAAEDTHVLLRIPRAVRETLTSVDSAWLARNASHAGRLVATGAKARPPHSSLPLPPLPSPSKNLSEAGTQRRCARYRYGAWLSRARLGQVSAEQALSLVALGEALLLGGLQRFIRRAGVALAAEVEALRDPATRQMALHHYLEALAIDPESLRGGTEWRSLVSAETGPEAMRRRGVRGSDGPASGYGLRISFSWNWAAQPGPLPPSLLPGHSGVIYSLTPIKPAAPGRRGRDLQFQWASTAAEPIAGLLAAPAAAAAPVDAATQAAVRSRRPPCLQQWRSAAGCDAPMA